MFTINYSDPDKHGQILNGERSKVTSFEDALIIADCVAETMLLHLDSHSPAMVSVRYNGELLGAYCINWSDQIGKGYQWKTHTRITGVND